MSTHTPSFRNAPRRGLLYDLLRPAAPVETLLSPERRSDLIQILIDACSGDLIELGATYLRQGFAGLENMTDRELLDRHAAKLGRWEHDPRPAQDQGSAALAQGTPDFRPGPVPLPPDSRQRLIDALVQDLTGCVKEDPSQLRTILRDYVSRFGARTDADLMEAYADAFGEPWK